MFGLLVLAALFLAPPEDLFDRNKKQATGSSAESLIRSLAAKWGAIFGVPPEYIVRIASIESSFKPTTKNVSPRAAKLGGAWGPLQVVLTTARDIVGKLQGSSNPNVQSTLGLWHGQGEDLFQPDLGVMLGAWYLAQLYKRFGAWPLVAGAYQQGPGKIAAELAKGATAGDIASHLPPHGATYVAMAEKAVSRVG